MYIVWLNFSHYIFTSHKMSAEVFWSVEETVTARTSETLEERIIIIRMNDMIVES